MRGSLLAAVLITVPLILSVPATRAQESKPVYPGLAMAEAYFQRRVANIEKACLDGIKTREDWEKRRPELRRQFFEMLGLWPLPERTDLHATVTGRVEAERFTVEKVVFQSRPGLYVTGNLYLPKKAKALPAVLYVCGHGNVVRDGVSFGSKVYYQHHPTWFAENGYVCLVLDTLELGEIPGDHHGTSRRGMWWWQSAGYTPAGVECWNAMRALDYLESRPEVDRQRLGVTGRSGGGATSWWVAAADDRVQCIIPVAGIGDLRAHLLAGEMAPYLRGGVIGGHCDCMYMVNTYQWDFPLVAALCAPRPLLLGNSDTDSIFPVSGYRRLAEKVRPIYDLYGAGERFALLETAGPHKDTPELRLGAFRWLNRWLKNDAGPVVETVRDPFTPQQLRVLDRIPSPVQNPQIHEQFVAASRIEPPASLAAWEKKAGQLRTQLASLVFAGWPRQPLAPTPSVVADVRLEGVRLRCLQFASEDDISLKIWVATADGATPKEIIVTPVEESGWQDWLMEWGPMFSTAFPGIKMPSRNAARFNQLRGTLRHENVAWAILPVRGVGPSRWADDGSKEDVLMRRRFALIGQTLDGQRIWDLRQAVASLAGLPDLVKVPVALQGTGNMSVLALHAALDHPGVARISMWNPPTSYKSGPALLNVLRFMDLPQAAALALPRRVDLHVATESDAMAWTFPRQVNDLLGKKSLTIHVSGD